MNRAMAVAIRSERELELLRNAGRIVGRILETLQREAQPGVTTGELARISDEIIARAGAIALFKGVVNPQAEVDFPASICTSINEQVVHGIPGDRQLRSGDLLSVDCGVKLRGYCGDAAVTIAVGDIDTESQRLLEVTREVLTLAAAEIKPGRYWSEVAGKMQKHAEDAGFSVVRDYVGHGIGRKMHEDPKLPNFVSQELLNNDVLLRRGMVLAVEPMVNMGTHRVRVLEDGWTVITGDGKPSGHFEHTIAVTENGARVLTEPGD